MKRLLIFFIVLLFMGGPKVFSNDSAAIKDSLLKVLDTLPADSSRLKVLYSLARLEPMSPSCIHYLDKLLEEAVRQNNKEYQCNAMYRHVVYYFNHQDEENTELWMDKLSRVALEHKCYDLYFQGKRAEITMHLLNRKIEYGITEADEMYKFAYKLNNALGMSSAKLCLMTAYLMTARYKEGMKAATEAYRLLPVSAPLDVRKDVLQEITLSCFSIDNKKVLKYLYEFKTVLDELLRQNHKLRNYKGSYLLLESLFAEYYLNVNDLEKARYHLKEMDRYFSPATYVTSRGLYYNTYAHYYRMIKEYDKSLAYSDSAIMLLSEVSDDGGLNYRIRKAGVLAEAGRLDEAIPLYQSLLAKKDSFYRNLSTTQMDEIYQMRDIDDLLLEKEQNKELIHLILIALIAIALLVLIPSTIRIFRVRKRLKREEEEIREMSRIAEEANEVKSRFLANMSYNIRIPLNNVLGFSRLMTANPDDVDAARWKKYSEIVQSNSEELIQLVNDVLDLSRLEAGKMKWQVQEYDIVPLCSDTISMARMKCGDKIQVDFQTDIESQPFQVDIARFSQVILSTLIYADPCEDKRTVTFFLHRDVQKELFRFRVVNSPLADPALQTQKVEVRHGINRLTITYFGGKYTVEPNAPEGPTITFTYPYSGKK